MRRRTLGALPLILGAGLLASSCSAVSTSRQADAWLSDHDLRDLDARTVIDTLEAQPIAESPRELAATIQPRTLTLSDTAGNDMTMDLPTEEFYVAIAPFRESTHECSSHSLTTCRGELGSEAMSVSVVDTATGDHILTRERSTFANGFLGLWLPRGLSGTLTVQTADGAGSIPLSTGDDDPTCVTSLRLT